jgi:hypothetical protein
VVSFFTLRWYQFTPSLKASFQLSKDVKLNAIVGHYMMGKDMEYLSHPAFGNYASYERNPTWVIIGLTFTPNIFKQ